MQELAQRVVNIVAAKANGEPPTVEGVQDIVEMVLQAAGEFEAAKRYILYRAEHAKQRDERPIPEEVRAAFAASDQYFPTPLQKFQFFDKYSRFNYELGRRETWIETVDRAVDFLHELAGDRLPAETYERIRRGILEMRVDAVACGCWRWPARPRGATTSRSTTARTSRSRASTRSARR